MAATDKTYFAGTPTSEAPQGVTPVSQSSTLESTLEETQRSLRMLTQELQALHTAYGQLLIQEYYNEKETWHLTTGINGNFIEFTNPVKTVTIFLLTSTVVYVDTEAMPDPNAASSTSAVIPGAVGSWITIPVKSKRVYAKTLTDVTCELAVWGLR